MKVSFALARLRASRTGKDWLLMKKADAHADPSWNLHTELRPARLARLAVRTLRARRHDRRGCSEGQRTSRAGSPMTQGAESRREPPTWRKSRPRAPCRVIHFTSKIGH